MVGVMKDLFELEHLRSVKFYPYRTAIVRNRFIKIDRNSFEGRQFEELLAEKAGANPDNHTAYTLELFTYGSEPAPKLHVMCSDAYISIGTEIEFGGW